jgi:hypothetical protein
LLALSLGHKCSYHLFPDGSILYLLLGQGGFNTSGTFMILLQVGARV